jgi:hypothetical protein
MNILQVSKVKVVDTPIVNTRLMLNWTPSSTTCSTSHWLPQSAPQLPLVTSETLCWNRKHVLSNLGSLTGVYSRFSSYQRRVAVTFGCAYLSRMLVSEESMVRWGDQTYFALWKIIRNYLLGRKIWNHFVSSRFLLLHLHKISQKNTPISHMQISLFYRFMVLLP